jgi:hypothetical protein
MQGLLYTPAGFALHVQDETQHPIMAQADAPV